jgi:hypothetical protein
MTSRTPKWLLPCAVSLLALAAGQAQAADQEWSTGRTRGFAIEYFWFAMSNQPDDCPNGFSFAMSKYGMGIGGADAVTYTAGRPSKGGRFAGLRNNGIEEQCQHPAAFEEAPMRTGDGTVAYGLDLDGTSDGAAKANTCAHGNFTSPAGDKGVDNQLYRILGCINGYRPESRFQGNALKDFATSARQDGALTTLIEVTGIDDIRNDDRVEIGVYSSTNPTAYDSSRIGVPYVSYTATDNPAWRTVTTGKIVDGVLTSDPVDLRFDYYIGQGLKDHNDLLIKGARFRLEIGEDGNAKGVLAGYSDVETFYRSEFGQNYPVLPQSYGYTCPAVYAAMWKLADGHPDPKTGQCTSISSAFEIRATPAFVVHPKVIKAPDVRTAQASMGSEELGDRVVPVELEGDKKRSVQPQPAPAAKVETAQSESWFKRLLQ